MAGLLITIANNVKEHRESKGLTQQELAEISGLHRNYILDVEKGSRNLTVITLEKIAKAMNIPIERLFDESK